MAAVLFYAVLSIDAFRRGWEPLEILCLRRECRVGAGYCRCVGENQGILEGLHWDEACEDKAVARTAWVRGRGRRQRE